MPGAQSTTPSFECLPISLFRFRIALIALQDLTQTIQFFRLGVMVLVLRIGTQIVHVSQNVGVVGSHYQLPGRVIGHSEVIQF